MSLPNLDKIVGSKGAKIINDTEQFTASISMIVVLENTVFSNIRSVGTTDVKAEYITDPTTAVKAGAIITGIGFNFVGVKLTSGSINVVLD